MLQQNVRHQIRINCVTFTQAAEVNARTELFSSLKQWFYRVLECSGRLCSVALRDTTSKGRTNLLALYH